MCWKSDVFCRQYCLDGKNLKSRSIQGHRFRKYFVPLLELKITPSAQFSNPTIKHTTLLSLLFICSERSPRKTPRRYNAGNQLNITNYSLFRSNLPLVTRVIKNLCLFLGKISLYTRIVRSMQRNTPKKTKFSRKNSCTFVKGEKITPCQTEL